MITIHKKFLTLAIFFSLPACEAFRGHDDVEPIGAAGARAEGVDLVISEDDEMAENPERFVDKKVLVRGKVGSFIGPALFNLDYDGLLGLSTVPVLVDTAGLGVVTEGDRVEVVGDVRMFVIGEVERYVDDDLDDDLFIDYENKPVVMAEKITRLNVD